MWQERVRVIQETTYCYSTSKNCINNYFYRLKDIIIGKLDFILVQL